MAHKLDKTVVLYYRPKDVGESEGSRCGKCMMYSERECTVVKGEIEPKHGVCGLYVHGEHMGPMMKGMTPKEIVGYVENGPTHCGNCKNFDDGECRIVEGKVEFEGCCNAWEELEEERDHESELREHGYTKI